MTKPYEIEITETRTITTRVMVQADGWREAQAKALRGEIVVAGEPRQPVDPIRSVTDHSMIRQGTTLKRVAAVLDKPDAFTIHARLWTSDGLGPRREYAVVGMAPQDGVSGVTLQEFPEGRRLFVPENEIYDIRIESESGETSYRVSDIRYDTDGETAIVDLPEEMEIDLPSDTDEEDVEEMLGDAITERTGWCHKGFDYEVAA